jgi:hypothetical protein
MSVRSVFDGSKVGLQDRDGGEVKNEQMSKPSSSSLLPAIQLREMQRSRDPGRDKTPAAVLRARASYNDFETSGLELVFRPSSSTQNIRFRN